MKIILCPECFVRSNQVSDDNGNLFHECYACGWIRADVWTPKLVVPHPKTTVMVGVA